MTAPHDDALTEMPNTYANTKTNLSPAVSPVIEEPPAPAPTPLTPPRPAMTVSDGWADPINSLELGPSPPTNNRDITDSARGKMANDNDLQFGKIHLDEDDETSSDDDCIEESPVEDKAGSDAEHDDARDVMNFPPSYVPPSHRPSNLPEILEGVEEATKGDMDALKHRREELEAQLEQEGRGMTQSEHGDSFVNKNPRLSTSGHGPSLSRLQEEAAAVEIVPGVVVVDPEELDKIMSPDRISEADSPAVATPGSPFSGLKKIDKAIDSSDAGLKISTTAVLGSPTESDISSTPIAVSPLSRLSKGADGSPPTPSPPPRPGSSRRVSFAAEPTVIGDPFTGTVKQLKSFKAEDPARSTDQKENTPYRPRTSRTRRNAATPQEFEEYKKDVSSDEEDLEKYRHADLAPLDPVMEGDNAGDLILSTPTSNKEEEGKGKSEDGKQPSPMTPAHSFASSHYSQSPFAKRFEQWHDTVSPYSQGKVRPGQLSPDQGRVPARRLVFPLGETPELHDQALLRQWEEIVGQWAAEDAAKRSFTGREEHGNWEERVGRGAVDEQQNMQKLSRPVYKPEEHPAIINALGMVPSVMFWGGVSLVEYASNKALDTVLDQFNLLNLRDKKDAGQNSEDGGINAKHAGGATLGGTGSGKARVTGQAFPSGG